MPVITCPKCKGKLRFPDDSPARRVKCPTCGNVFLSSDGIDPNDPLAKAASRQDLPRARDSRGEFDLPMDDDDRPRRSRDDDDRGRPSRRRDDDDDSDRGRGRSRRRDDDDDDRHRGRSRRRDDDDDDRDRGGSRRGKDRDDYDRPRRRRDEERAIEGQYHRASLACLLNFIAGWLQVAAFGLMFFVVFLHWCGITEGLRVFAVLAGLLGLGYWLTSGTGFGFLVSGPRKRGALGLSIATAAVAGLHLMLIIVIATSRNWGGFGNATIDRTAELHFEAFVSQLRALPILMFWVIGVGDIRPGLTDGSFLPVFTNLAEAGRIILFLLTLRAIMVGLREDRAASLCTKTTVGFAIGAGGLIVVGMLFGILLMAIRPDRLNQAAIESINAIGHLFFLVLYLVLAGMAVGVNLVVKSVKHNLDYR
jgi:hypothetical protein